MTKPIHRNDDKRTCEALTSVSGQGTVYANGRLVSVNDDLNSHGGGALIAACKKVYAGSKMVVIVGNSASGDNQDHTNPAAKDGSHNVNVGE